MFRRKIKGRSKRPMTNYEYLQSISIEEYAEKRIDQNIYEEESYWMGDFRGVATSYEEALEKEIEWLKEERKENEVGEEEI